MARTKKKAARRRWQLPRDQLGLIGAAVALIALSFLEPYVWLGALVNELGFHLALASTLTAAIALYKRAWWVAGAAVAVVLFFAWPLAPLYRTTKPTPQTGPTLRVAASHLAGVDLDEKTLATWLERERPDAAAFTGLKGDMNLGTRFGGYRVARGHEDLRAILLVQSALVVPMREHPVEHPVLTVRAGRCQARTVGLELPPLGAYTALDARARAIARVTEWKSTPRSIWLGHLGSRAEAQDLSPWIAAHALRDARLGHGRLATGPGSLGALGFPLTDVLVHGWISVRDVAVRDPIVSGAQRTVTAVLELTEPRCRFASSDPLE